MWAVQSCPPAPLKNLTKSRKAQKALRDFAFMTLCSLNTSRQGRCHPRFLLVKMLVKVLPATSNGDFTSMGKLTDTKLRAMKPNGKVQKESDGDWLYAYIGAKSKSISWQKEERYNIPTPTVATPSVLWQDYGKAGSRAGLFGVGGKRRKPPKSPLG